MRDTIIAIIFCLALMAASFFGGALYENRRSERRTADLQVLQERVENHEGRITMIEGPALKAPKKKVGNQAQP
jgi:uncharacterized iron-regulated membrane protein